MISKELLKEIIVSNEEFILQQVKMSKVGKNFVGESQSGRI